MHTDSFVCELSYKIHYREMMFFFQSPLFSTNCNQQATGWSNQTVDLFHSVKNLDIAGGNFFWINDERRGKEEAKQ